MAQRYGHISTDARRAAMESMNASRPVTTNVEERESHDKGGAIH